MTDGVHDEYPIDDKPEERERRRQAEADARVWAYIRDSLDEHYEQRKVDYDAVFEGLRFHGVSAKLLVFPDENHWILKPRNIKAWHGHVLEFVRAWTAGPR
jgi:hypothetical protein